MAAPGGLNRPLGGPGYELVERARDSIVRHRMLAGGETVIVGVSGGPDSACLLDVLARLSAALQLNLHVAHIDHALSPQSAEIAARVSADCAAKGFEVHLVEARDLSGPNLHARARDLRYRFFELVADEVGATRIATGHTLDDRVETTLARLVHGAGTGVLAGLRPADPPRIRPLIDVRRAATRSYCDELGLLYVDDPANADERFERVKVRNHLLAPIEQKWGPGAVAAVARSAERLGEDAGALGNLADAAYGSLAHSEPTGVRLDRSLLEQLPRALRRRVLERAIGRVRDREQGIDVVLDALDEGKRAVRFTLGGGIEIVVENDLVRVQKRRD